MVVEFAEVLAGCLSSEMHGLFQSLLTRLQGRPVFSAFRLLQVHRTSRETFCTFNQVAFAVSQVIAVPDAVAIHSISSCG